MEPGQHLCEVCREEGPGPVATRATATRERRRPPELQERESRWLPEMPRPSPVQYHATVMVVVFLVLLGIAAFAFWSHHGVGPFKGHVETFHRQAHAVQVTATVQNLGSKTARSTCRISLQDASNVEITGVTVLTLPIPAHQSVALRETVPNVDAAPASASISCD